MIKGCVPVDGDTYDVPLQVATAEARYKSLKQRKAVRTTNAIERRFVEVRRRTRPMGVFQDTTSMDRILYVVFSYENKSQGISIPFPLTQNY